MQHRRLLAFLGEAKVGRWDAQQQDQRHHPNRQRDRVADRHPHTPFELGLHQPETAEDGAGDRRREEPRDGRLAELERSLRKRRRALAATKDDGAADERADDPARRPLRRDRRAAVDPRRRAVSAPEADSRVQNAARRQTGDAAARRAEGEPERGDVEPLGSSDILFTRALAIANSTKKAAEYHTR